MGFFPSAAAVALDDGVGNDDLGGGQVGVFHMVDDLVCRLLTQEEGVDIHGSELRGGQLGIEGIIEGDDGDVIGDPQALLDADPFQRQGENIIADHEGRGPIGAVQKPPQMLCRKEWMLSISTQYSGFAESWWRSRESW